MRRAMSAIAVLVVLCAAAVAVGAPLARQAETHEEVVRRLDAEAWAPPSFAGVEPFRPQDHEPLIAAMREEPFTLVRAGAYEYRTSPARVELGRRLFAGYDWGTAEYWRPAQRFTFFALEAATPGALEERWGILIDRQGKPTGITAREASDGRIDYGWSCALCHAGHDADGRPVPGAPNHRLDYGAIHHRAIVAHPSRPSAPGPGILDRDTPIADLIALRPGRLDMNGDRVVNPVKIPALWGLRSNRSGIFANGSVGNIWMGIAHNGGPFPASDLIEAIVAYVLSLDPPPNPRPQGDREARGRGIFEREGCASCHAGPDYTNGEVIPIEAIGTDAARARVEFPKGYRVPTLRRLDLQRIFLHDGSVASLGALFTRERLRTAPGHPFGLTLDETEREDLVAFLLSL